MNMMVNEGSEQYIEYGNEKLTQVFLKERIIELGDSLRSDESCDLLLTKKNLELNNRIYESCFGVQ
ncbi:hypothetical protein [Halobacteriovorax sp. JY17]|uniref:hypothetical protein n=1 Tax=Halobacteriovorax sp. JY17 TaxID=2014617 RepID=UPI000C355518|nr:hypothetical protein [Halobacteriovorax sp. JY17]PIK13617.1 MAG: hypothetical protein CES88_15615 [Halobacteriovorax sp. JY17]